MKYLSAGFVILLLLALPVQAERFKDIQIEETLLAPGLYMLTGSDGNMVMMAYC